MKNDDLGSFFLPQHTSFSLKIHKCKENWGELSEYVWMEKKLQQISIPFLICLSCLRTLLRGDYEFLKPHSLMQFSFPRRMRCNKSFDIVNFNSSRPVDLCLWSLKSLLHYFRDAFLHIFVPAISFSDFKAVKNVQS
jgi:hypothetical protein